MPRLRKKLLAFKDLNRQEQLELVEYLIAFPETFALVDAESLAAIFLQTPDLPSNDPATRAALAYVATYHYWSSHPPAGKVLALFTQVKAQLRERADLRAEFEAIEARALNLNAMQTPGAPVDSGTDHQQHPDASEEPERPDRLPRRRARAASSYLRWLRFDLPATPSSRMLGGGLAVIAGLLVLYGILAIADRATRSELYHLAYEEASIFPSSGSVRSGVNGSQQIAEQLLTDAVREVISSRRTVLGLFPRYDKERLQWAKEALRQVVRSEQANPWLRSEAGFLLGAVLIADGNLEEAECVLSEVAQGTSDRAEQAAAIIREIKDATGNKRTAPPQP